jgi:hypothetical protein
MNTQNNTVNPVAEKTETKQQNVSQIINATVKTNPTGGEIELSTLEKTLKLDRHSILEQCRELPKTFKLVVGRKGATSRVCYGDKIPAHMGQKRHYSTKRAEKLGNSPNEIHLPRLQIKIGNNVQTFDIGLALVA